MEIRLASDDTRAVLDQAAPASHGAALDHAALQHELQACRRQLDLLFDLARELNGRLDPEMLQGALLRRYGTILGARAIYVDRGGCCQRLESAAPAVETPLRPDCLRGCLANEIEAVRRARRTCLPALRADQRQLLGGAPVLLGTLGSAEAETAVIVAVRSPAAPAFDSADVLTSDAVLAYGAQVLAQARTVRHLRRTALETVCTLVNAIDAKDNYTSAHSERVGWLARLTGEALCLPRARLQTMEWAGLLHDVGKLGVPEQLLNKPGTLTAAEFEQMKEHARIGYDVLRPVAQFEPVLEAVLHHHENHDCSGYPAGLSGDQIPLEARIIHIVDIFDALTTTRPYRVGYTIGEACDRLRAGAGRITDPRLTQVFLETLEHLQASDPAGFRTRLEHLVPLRPAAPVSPVAGRPEDGS